MEIDGNYFAVDADALIKLMSIERNKDEVVDLIKDLFQKINKCAIVHPLVYSRELIVKNEIKSMLVNQNIIKVPTKGDICSEDEIKINLYELYFKTFYKWLNANSFPNNKDIWEYWKSDESLGESHSISMCLINECGIFLSDDKDSKKIEKLISDRQLGNIKVYKRSEIIYLPKCNELSRHQKKLITHT